MLNLSAVACTVKALIYNHFDMASTIKNFEDHKAELVSSIMIINVYDSYMLIIQATGACTRKPFTAEMYRLP